MKIAVSTADGKTVCGHLGKCRSFIIYEVADGEIKSRQLLGTGSMCGHGEGGNHNVSPLTGCKAVITQGMGQGMLMGLVQGGIQPVITKETDPDRAVAMFLSGELKPAATATCACGEH